MSWRRGIPVSWAALVILVSPASAHQVSPTRFDAPIPLALLYVGTGLTIALTAGFLVVTVRDRHVARRTLRRTTISARTGTILGRIARFIFLVAVAVAVIQGLLGRQAPVENFATVFVWALWLEGVALLAAVFGSPWRLLSPWRTIYDGLTRLESEEIALAGSYPTRFGSWPAVAFFVLGLGILENLSLVPRSPRATATLVSGYALCMIVGALLFGSEWFARADALAVFYRLVGRVAPFNVVRTETGRVDVEVRAPWSGCTDPVGDSSVAAVVVVALYTVTFDGFTSAPEFQTLLFAARGAGLAAVDAAVLAYLVGFAVFLGVFVTIAVWTARAAGADGRTTLLALAPTLLPIAVGYEIAHYYPFVFDNLGRAIELLAVAAIGAEVSVSPLWWLSLPAFWLSQVLLIVLGHVVAVVAVHYVLAERAPAERLGRATLPMTVLMICYTVLSLWIVSRPVVS